jgi:nucleoside 2-deoxyribosyltransferase
MDGYIYWAAPLFTRGERDFNSSVATYLRQGGLRVFLPQTECQGDPQAIFATCVRGVEGASIVVAVLDGADADSGTCWEVGFAYAKGIPILGIRTDFRGTGDMEGFNLMLKFSCTAVLNLGVDLDAPSIGAKIVECLRDNLGLL